PTKLVATTDKTDINCFGDKTGKASITVSGGTPGYTYQWSNGGMTAEITGIGAGTYTVTVTDANKCTVTGSVTITEPTPLTLTGIGTDVKCNGDANGTVTLTAGGGTTPYQYSKDGFTFQSSNIFNNLVAGLYTFTVKDINGCIKTTTVEVKQPDALTATPSKTDVTCYGGKDGSVTVNVLGGNAPYSYLWNTNSTTQTISGLAAGTYSVIITDAKGCKTTVSGIIVSQPVALVPNISATSPVCEGGTINLTADGGTNYSWKGPNGYTSSVQNPVISPATTSNQGVYTVTVTNASGCTGTATASVTIKTLPEINSGNGSVCEGEVLTLKAPDLGVGAIYKWTGPNGFSQNGQTVTIASATAANEGVYTITVTKDECSTSGTVTVDIKEKPASPTIKIDGSVDICDNTPVKLVAAGCTNGKVIWSTGQTSSSITVSIEGTYWATCKVGDCSSDVSNKIIITKGAKPDVPEISADKEICCDGAKAILTASGCNNGTLKWSTGETTSVIQVSTSGTYTVDCITSCGTARSVKPIIIRTGDSPTTPTIKTDKTQICGTEVAKLEASGCNGTVLWSNNATGSSITVNTPGTYSARCENICGTSVASNEIIISKGTPPSAPTVVADKNNLC
ncbi:SprB repeat-containing protein, partial [Emticicia fontis]